MAQDTSSSKTAPPVPTPDNVTSIDFFTAKKRVEEMIDRMEKKFNREAATKAQIEAHERTIADLRSDPQGFLNEYEESKRLTADLVKKATEYAKQVEAEENAENPWIFDKLPREVMIANFYEQQTGDAENLRYLLEGEFIYDHYEKKWYYWNDHYWRKDKVKNIYHKMRILCEAYETEVELQRDKAADTDDEEIRKVHLGKAKAFEERIKACYEVNRKKLILESAANKLDDLACVGDEWDLNPMTLCVKNGVIDLRTGELMPGKPSDMNRRVAPVHYHGLDAQAPIWEGFLRGLFDDKPEVYEYLFRLLGYGITGKVKESVFPIFWGPQGRNGKTAIMETLGAVLGKDLTIKTPATFMLQTKAATSAESPEAMSASLWGRRLVWACETSDGDKLNIPKIKELTGGDRMTARKPYADEPIQFDPSHLIIMVTNQRPKIPPNDPATWRRIVLIKFDKTYIANPDPNNPYERLEDPDIKERLIKEAPFVLSWLVRGCIAWQKDGERLKPPKEILAETLLYHENEDPVGLFLKDCCEVGPTLSTERGELYAAFHMWRREKEYKSILPKPDFFKDIFAKGFTEKRGHAGEARSTIRWFVGVELGPDGRKLAAQYYEMKDRQSGASKF